MTVCIAASSLGGGADPLIAMCFDMMGSTDFSSSETTFKWRPLGPHFHALLSGPISASRELATACHASLGRLSATPNMAEVMSLIRESLGDYKAGFAEAHIRSRLGISYAEFRTKGRSELPEALHAELVLEIKNHYSNAEMIVTGFIGKSPTIFKVAGDSVWSCDDFAVIGSGTLIAEASLYQREQSFTNRSEKTIYQIYEAKRLAEKAPGVGKRTQLIVIRPDLSHMQWLSQEGHRVLDSKFNDFSPRPVQMSAIPDDYFTKLRKTRDQQDPPPTTTDQSPPPPSPESPGGSGES